MQKRSSKFFLLSLFITLVGLSAVFLPIHTFGASSSSISVNINPSNPAPNESVSITLSSYTSNLDSVSISWSIDGKTLSSGIGKKSFTFTAGGAGSSTTISARISLPDGEINKQMTIRPSAMVLLWQANDSYVPPFYKGKALPTPDSEVKIVAMPEIRSGLTLVNPKNMTYSWKKDYTNEVDSSGYGRNFFTYVNDYLENSNTIEVVAGTVDQTSQSQASITVGNTTPKIIFYKNDAKLGTMWESALTNPHQIQGSEVLLAAPYFISPKDIRTPTLMWNWFINDSMVGIDGIVKNIMPLQATSGTSGTSTVKLQIENKYKIFGAVEKTIDIQF